MTLNPEKLQSWAAKLVDGYPGVRVRDLSKSWADGLAFCALVHR